MYDEVSNECDVDEFLKSLEESFWSWSDVHCLCIDSTNIEISNRRKKYLERY